MKKVKGFFNVFGQRLITHVPKFLRRKWGKISRDFRGKCYADPFWDVFRKKNTNCNGFLRQGKFLYCVPHILKKGTIIARYGVPFGRCATDFGTPYHMLGLPFIKGTIEYHVYRVLDDIKVFKGIVAPIFNSPGGGVQYYFYKERINELLNEKHPKLEEVFVFGQ